MYVLALLAAFVSISVLSPRDAMAKQAPSTVRLYEGDIGGSRVVVSLERSDDGVSYFGRYFYRASRFDISLQGEARDGALNLKSEIFAVKPNTVQLITRMAFSISISGILGSDFLRIGNRLIFRLTPRLLRRQRRTGRRSSRISSRTASCSAALRRGGNGEKAWKLSLDDANRMNERKSVWIDVGFERRFMHQAAKMDPVVWTTRAGFLVGDSVAPHTDIISFPPQAGAVVVRCGHVGNATALSTCPQPSPRPAASAPSRHTAIGVR